MVSLSSGGGNLSANVDCRLSDEGLVFVSPEKAKEFSRSVVRKGDLIFTCWGTINQIGFLDGSSKFDEYIISNKQMKLTPDPDRVDPLFLYYVFSSPIKQAEILANGIGAAVPGFNLGQLKKHIIQLPPIAIQKRIAHILGLLDDKIELNRQINQTLEQIAQTLFKSWFVNFEPVKAKLAALRTLSPALSQREREAIVERAAMCAISGAVQGCTNAASAGRAGAAKHESELDQLPPEQYQQLAATAALFPDALVESELGLIPVGWGVCTVDEEFDLTMGQSPPGNTYNDSHEGLPFYQGRTDFGFRFPTQRIFCSAPTRFADVGDTLVSVRAPVGDINMATERCCIGRGVAAARHKSKSRSYTFYFMQSIEEVFARFEAEGTVFGSISKKDFHNIQCVKTSGKIITEFERLSAPIDEMISNNEQESRTLATLRDTLLPKLLSGKLASTVDDSLSMEQGRAI
jgi:type I restriction enzyme S subunit